MRHPVNRPTLAVQPFITAMRILCSCLLLLFSWPLLQAQIVNIESSRMQSDTVGWKGKAGLNLAFTKYEKEITLINFDAHLQYKSKKSLWLILGDYGFLKGGDERFIFNSFAHLRYNHKVNKWLRWEVFTQAQNNYITMIDARYLAGTGPRFKLYDTKRFRLYVASLLMYEYEKERTKQAVIHKNARNSSYISFTILPDDNMEIISTTFFQPLLQTINDARLLNQSVVRVKAGRRFWVGLLWNYLYDRFPAGDAPKTTYNFSMGVNVDF